MNFVTKLRKLPASDVYVPASSSISFPSGSVDMEPPVVTIRMEEAEGIEKEKIVDFLKERTPEPDDDLSDETDSDQDISKVPYQ
jgi:hypothetical protein